MYSTFGFSWMHSSIQDTWYDKRCSFDVQGANQYVKIKYSTISEDTSDYLKISYYIYFFLCKYSTFGFSWTLSSIQDTWYDKCCSFNVPGAH